MTNFGTRLNRVVEEMTGNESLLQMLDTEAATEMLNWGIATAKAIVSKAQDLDDFAADLAILPRLKAVRQTMRSIGNWAAGNYADPESRVQLRNKLLQNFRVIFGDDSNLPSVEKMDTVLNQVDDKTNTPNQLILKLKQVLDETGNGEIIIRCIGACCGLHTRGFLPVDRQRSGWSFWQRDYYTNDCRVQRSNFNPGRCHRRCRLRL